MLTAFAVKAAEEEAPSLLLPTLPDLIWGTIVFVIILAFFIWRVVPRLNAALDARADAIEGGLKRAEEAQASLVDAIAAAKVQAAWRGRRVRALLRQQFEAQV